jgi:hypothetical protein
VPGAVRLLPVMGHDPYRRPRNQFVQFGPSLSVFRPALPNLLFLV